MAAIGLVAIACLCLLSSAWGGESGARAISLSAGTSEEVRVRGQDMELLEDTGAELGIGQVSAPGLSQSFMRGTEDAPAFAHTDSAIWARFGIRNESPDPILRRLIFEDSRIVDVDFYLLDGHGDLLRHERMGRAQPVSGRKTKYRKPVFEIVLPGHEDRTVYLRIRSDGDLSLPLSLWPRERFEETLPLEYWLLGLYYGAMLIMFGYSVALFVYLRESSYLYLGGVIVGIAVNQGTRDGALFQFLLQGSFYSVHGPVLGGFLGLAALAMYTVAFLDTARIAPRLHYLLLAFAAFNVAMLLYSTVRPDAIPILNASALATLPPLLFAGVFALRQGFRPARYFLLGWALFFLALYLLVSAHSGLLPALPVFDSAMHVGAVLLVLLLSLSLADRINLLKTDAEQAILALRENEAHLEELVNERTAELEKARDKAEAANRAKSEFLANVSHEIRTPMNAVLGFSSLLRERGQSPENLRFLDAIRSAGKTLLRLIDDILDLSRVEAGKLELRPAPVDLRALIRELGEMYAERVAEKGLHLRATVDPDVPRALSLDEVRVRQILANLVGNAVKYTGQGRIKVRARVKAEEDIGFRLEILVSDTGAGIPLEQQKDIFAPFSRNAPRDSRVGGAGLGLAICMRLAKLMGGEIGVRSSPGTGSTFALVLRRVAAVEPAPLPDSSTRFPVERFSTEKILITDDDPLNRRLLEHYLGPQGFELLEAETGAQALRLARAEVPDLILMDIGLPGSDGIAVTRALKSDPVTRNIPVIAVTAAAMGPRAEEAASVCDGYLSKPVSKATLLDAIAPFLAAICDSTASSERPSSESGDPIADAGAGELGLSATMVQRISALRFPYCPVDEIEEVAQAIRAEGERAADPAIQSMAERLFRAAHDLDLEAAGRVLEEAGVG